MDPLPTFITFSVVVSCILTLICAQQVLITPIQSKTDRPLLTVRIFNLLFGFTETIYIILCLTDATRTRFIFEMMRYLFLSICLLTFILDRLQYLYKMHINQQLPFCIRTLYISLCGIFNISLIIAFSLSLYRQSSFYWKIQLIHLKFDAVISCVVAIIAACHIYYKFNQKIQIYLDSILSQHNQLKQIQTINNKLLDSNYMSQLIKTHGLPINHHHSPQNAHKLRREDILANNFELAAKIRRANKKLYSYILLLFICAIIDFIYIPISINRLHTASDLNHMILTSNTEYIFQRILFHLILITLIYWMYDRHSLFKILSHKRNRTHKHKLCVISCLNCSLFVILFRDIYLLIIYCMNNLCPCCISQNCLNLQQHIYDIKKYQSYFGHLPKTKKSFTMIPDTNDIHYQWSDVEESLPSKQLQNGNVFGSPPPHNNHNKRRSVCGAIPMLGVGIQMNANMDLNDSKQTDINLSESNSDTSYDLHVPQQIIDIEAENDDLQDFDDNKSEQYDNFADIMMKRERDYLHNQRNKNRPKHVNIISDKNIYQNEVRSQSQSRGSIANLGKKRRGSLILTAVDNIRAGIKNITNLNSNLKERQQQKRECHKEAQFLRATKNKLMHIPNYNMEADVSNDDEKEYYNTKTIETLQNSHHKRSHDRLSAMRNSLKSILPNKFSNNSNYKKNKKNIVHNYNLNNNYEPFEYATDTMVIHVKQDLLTTDTDDMDMDDDASIATYGTAKDCLDDEFESELNALQWNVEMNPSVSPNSGGGAGGVHVVNAEEEEEEEEESVSLSLESISNSMEEEASPAPPRIIKQAFHGRGRGRKQSIPLEFIQESGGNSSDYGYGGALGVMLTSGEDFSCDDIDMMAEAVL